MSTPARIPQTVEAEAVAEQITRALRKEITELLSGRLADMSSKIVSGLNGLEQETANLIQKGTFTQAEIVKLQRGSLELEKLIDETSESHWKNIGISIAHHFTRLAKAAEAPEPSKNLQGEIRAHFHSLRLRLLQQTHGARNLRNSNDLGDETETIFKEFFQRHLGSRIRVVKGGEIRDYDGNSSGQIDLLIVPDDALLTFPADTKDGKANVFVDQVLAAVMVGANLTTTKLDTDWRALQKIPAYADKSSDFSGLSDHPWPLCYIIGGRSDPIEKLEETWKDLCGQGFLRHIPQFLLSLDSGYVYSGSRRWPCPRYPRNYTAPDQVANQTGIYSGLGLAWILLQIRGRMTHLEGKSPSTINRQQTLLHDSMYSIAGRESNSNRLSTAFASFTELLGPIRWGSNSCNVHNRLQLHSVSVGDHDLFRDGADPQSLSTKELFTEARMFEYPSHEISDDMIAFREILTHQSKKALKIQYVVFTADGEELISPKISEANSFSDALGVAKQQFPISDSEESFPQK